MSGLVALILLFSTQQHTPPGICGGKPIIRLECTQTHAPPQVPVHKPVIR